MGEAKTRPTAEPVEELFLRQTDEARRQDCRELARLMARATGAEPVMWGTGIVGFGQRSVSYASGPDQPWPVIGFAPRKSDLTLYLGAAALASTGLLARLGRHKAGKGCLYLKNLKGVDLTALAELIDAAVAGKGA